MSAPAKYSADWVKRQVAEANAAWLNHHGCALCGTVVGYSFHGDGDRVFFHSDCECTTYQAPPRIATFEEIAQWLAVQRDDEMRDLIMGGLRAHQV